MLFQWCNCEKGNKFVVRLTFASVRVNMHCDQYSIAEINSAKALYGPVLSKSHASNAFCVRYHRTQFIHV